MCIWRDNYEDGDKLILYWWNFHNQDRSNTWTFGSGNWLMAGSVGGGILMKGMNGSQASCQLESPCSSGGGRAESKSGAGTTAPTRHNPELLGIIHTQGGGSAFICHSCGWPLKRGTGIIPTSYTRRSLLCPRPNGSWGRIGNTS